MASLKITDLTSIPSVDRAVNVVEIVDVAGNASYKVTPNNLLGFTGGNPVSTSDTQTLTNKALTAPTIASPVLSGTITGTYTLAGTPTFPAAVATLTGSQTLTNKILTSPTINAPTITNASITADAITGFSSANTGTIYGMAVTASVITSASVGTSAIVAAAVTAAKMQFGMVRQRQGGTTGDATWQTTGTSNTDTSAKSVFTQAGSVACTSGAVTVTFPTAYTQIPLVLGTTSSANSVNSLTVVKSITTTNFIIYQINPTSGAGVTSETANWLAIGQ